MASRNELGTIGDDGVLRDFQGKEVPVGLDEASKKELQDRIDGPKVRHMPSEMDAFKSLQGSVEAKPYKLEDSTQSGTVEDLPGKSDKKASK